MKRSDIYFSADDAHAFLPWVIGIMACMATTLLCLSLTIGGWIVDRHDHYTNSFTVNVPAMADDTARVDKIRDALQKLPGVTSVTQLSEEKLRDMLKPWLGGGDAVAELPLPAVLDVVADGTTAIDYKDVQNRLDAIAPGTEVDAHEHWIASFSDFSAAVRFAISALATLIIGSLALMIAFTSRASLRLHAKAVQLLHSIGAEDSYIARQFQQEAFLLALRGAVSGCIAGGFLYWAAGYYIASLQSAALPALAVTGGHGLLVLLMPLACGGVAWLAARLAVLRQLQRVL